MSKLYMNGAWAYKLKNNLFSLNYTCNSFAV